MSPAVPIYAYQAAAEPGCDYCIRGFEKLQRLRDDALEHCPRCHGPIKRLVSAPRVISGELSDREVAEKGFTRYRRREKGVYEKTAGSGPDRIGDDD